MSYWDVPRLLSFGFVSFLFSVYMGYFTLVCCCCSFFCTCTPVVWSRWQPNSLLSFVQAHSAALLWCQCVCMCVSLFEIKVGCAYCIWPWRDSFVIFELNSAIGIFALHSRCRRCSHGSLDSYTCTSSEIQTRFISFWRYELLTYCRNNTLTCPLFWSSVRLQPEELTNALEISNIVFTSLFALEMLLKILVYGPFGYIKNPYNIFDGIIVVIRWAAEKDFLTVGLFTKLLNESLPPFSHALPKGPHRK